MLVVVPTLGTRPLEALLNAVASECNAITAQDCTPLLLHNAPASPAIAALSEAAGVSYAHHEALGYSQIRNEAIRRAVDDHYDVLVMIDDDELPARGWLAALLEPFGRGADVVVGPVLTAWPETAPSRYAHSALPRPVVNRHDGPIDEDLRSGNCAIRVATLGPLRFDDRFNIVGGEDTALFRRLRNAGARCYWAQSASVTELVDADRVSLSYFARRTFAQGRGLAAIRRLVPRQDDPPAAQVIRTRFVRATRLAAWALTRRRPEHLLEAACEVAFLMGFVAGRVKP